jgi:hypothetical protein
MIRNIPVGFNDSVILVPLTKFCFFPVDNIDDGNWNWNKKMKWMKYFIFFILRLFQVLPICIVKYV